MVPHPSLRTFTNCRYKSDRIYRGKLVLNRLVECSGSLLDGFVFLFRVFPLMKSLGAKLKTTPINALAVSGAEGTQIIGIAC